MSDYIKREDAIKLKDICTDTYTDKKYFIEQLKAIPSADVVEVRHGKWIDDEGQQVLMENEIAKGENWKVCSVCGAGMCIGAKYETDRCYHPFFQSYCPNCGAKMDGEEQDHD